MRALALLVLAAALLPACSKRTVTITPPAAVANTMSAGMFIDTPGSYHFGDRSESHDLDVTLSGQDIGWSISTSRTLPHGGRSTSTSRTHPHGGSSGSSGGGGMRMQAAGDPWFIFVESPGSYWMCDGSQRLDYHLNDEHGSNGGSAVHGGKLMPSAPKVPVELIPRLPAEMQKLFPPVEPPRKRPSI
jgi:hypothetical protein